MSTSRTCGRLKSHIMADGEKSYSVTGVEIRDKATGEVVFSHAGFDELCEASREIIERHMRIAFRMNKTGRKPGSKKKTASAPPAIVESSPVETPASKVEEALAVTS